MKEEKKHIPNAKNNKMLNATPIICKWMYRNAVNESISQRLTIFSEIVPKPIMFITLKLYLT